MGPLGAAPKTSIIARKSSFKLTLHIGLLRNIGSNWVSGKTAMQNSSM